MRRTTVLLDETLLGRVMRLYGLKTKRAAIDFALRALVGDRSRRDMLDLEGAGWDGDLVPDADSDPSSPQRRSRPSAT